MQSKKALWIIALIEVIVIIVVLVQIRDIKAKQVVIDQKQQAINDPYLAGKVNCLWGVATKKDLKELSIRCASVNVGE